MRPVCLALTSVFFSILCGCHASGVDRWSAVSIEAIDGFAIPESVAIDPVDGTAYVSNIDAATPGQYWADDKKGSIDFLTELPGDGSATFARCEQDSPLHSPKGMCVVDRSLWVADNTRLRCYSLTADMRQTTIEVPGAQKLNDVAVHNGVIYVSDTGAGQVHCVRPDGSVKTIPAPPSVNGITFDGDRMYAVSWGEHEVYELDPHGNFNPRPFGLATHFTNLDGIVVLDDGTFIVSDVIGNAIWLIGADRRTVRLLIELDSPADIGLDRKRMRLYVPQFMKDRVAVYDLKRQ